MEVSAKYSNYQDTEWVRVFGKEMVVGWADYTQGEKKLFYFFLRVQWIFQEQIWTNPLFFFLLINFNSSLCMCFKYTEI